LGVRGEEDLAGEGWGESTGSWCLGVGVIGSSVARFVLSHNFKKRVKSNQEKKKTSLVTLKKHNTRGKPLDN